MTDPNPIPDALSEQERTFLDSLNADMTAPDEESAALTATWLAMAAFADTDEIRGMRQDALQAAGVVKRPARRSAQLFFVGMAACLTLALGAGSLALWSNRMQTFTAPAQGIARVTLADGTGVTLSAGGKIRSRIGKTRRDIELLRGDAYFAVTHDASRPLTVASGDHRAIDLGTEFNISQTSDSYRLTLIDGAVRVKNLRTGYSGDLSPGQTYVDHAGAERVTMEASRNAAGWAHGQLAFEDASLREVGATFSRLTGRRIIFSTPAVAELHLSGTVNLDNVERTSQAISAALPVTATPTAQGDIRVSPR